MALMFFQDKVAKNNHLFSWEKDLQLGNRSQGSALFGGKVYAVAKRSLKECPSIRQSIRQKH